MLSAEEFSQLRERAGLSRVEFVGRRLRIRPLMGVGSAGGVYRLACYETLLPGQWPALSRMAGSSDLRSAVMANLSPDRLPALYDIASVSHITRATRRGRGRDARGISIEALENRDALPRAYLVDRYQVIDDDEALTRVVSGDFDYRRMVLLDREPGLSEPGRLAKLVPAEILDYAPERVEVAVQTPSQALLILTDTYYAGWRATVDGSPTAIHRANGLFRAVLVPAGDHLVSFEYTPASLRVGAWVSVFSLLAALATVSVPTRLRRVGP
jgi:hypothetical protein